MNKYHIRLQSTIRVDLAESDGFVDDLLLKLNGCDYHKAIQAIKKDDLKLSFTKDGNLLVSFVLVIVKTRHRLKVLDKLLTVINKSDVALLSFK